MTPDEWHDGIRNEADSVQDTGWSQDTRRHLRRRAWLTAASITLGFTMITLSLMAVVNAALVGALAPMPPGVMQVIISPLNPEWLIISGLGYLLTRRGFKPLHAAASLLVAMILYSVTARLVTLNVQSMFPDGTSGTFDLLPAPQGVLSAAMLVPLTLNFAALGAGIGLARIKLRRTRTA